MTTEQLPDDAPGTALFPEFETQIYEWASLEVAGLTDEELDFESDRWGWSGWSIRRNLSHMASGDFRWFWQRWGKTLYPGGLPNGEELDRIVESPHDRRLDENVYWEIGTILEMLRRAQGLWWTVISAETVGSLQAKEIELDNNGVMVNYPQLFPRGLRENPNDSSKIFASLENTIRHRYFEHTTHLYNIQRLKRAQGLETVVDLPEVGYFTMPDWDRSEP